jgi:hypothetical protein
LNNQIRIIDWFSIGKEHSDHTREIWKIHIQIKNRIKITHKIIIATFYQQAYITLNNLSISIHCSKVKSPLTVMIQMAAMILVLYLKIIIVIPIIVQIDNVGAIYLSNNYLLGQRTKHIDIRRHFVWEFVEDGIIKTLFVWTDNNNADIHTKNTSEEVFKRHILISIWLILDRSIEAIGRMLKW